MDQVQEILQAEAVGLLLFNQARLTSNHAPVKADRSETDVADSDAEDARSGMNSWHHIRPPICPPPFTGELTKV